MTDKVQFGIVALCDNVYKDEQSKKSVLAGLYSGSILLEAFPAEVRFALYIEAFLPNLKEYAIDLKFYLDGKHVAGANILAGAEDNLDPMALILPQIGLPFSKPMTLEIKAVVDGGKPKRLLTKRIDLMRGAPTASSQPS